MGKDIKIISQVVHTYVNLPILNYIKKPCIENTIQYLIWWQNVLLYILIRKCNLK